VRKLGDSFLRVKSVGRNTQQHADHKEGEEPLRTGPAERGSSNDIFRKLARRQGALSDGAFLWLDLVPEVQPLNS
jgi:hypothetical protein